jgi:hypothetical protein
MHYMRKFWICYPAPYAFRTKHGFIAHISKL